jgi:hypothetical protein
VWGDGPDRLVKEPVVGIVDRKEGSYFGRKLRVVARRRLEHLLT